MKTWHPIRLMAYSIALLALVLTIFVPLGYLELRRQARRTMPPAPITPTVESPVEQPATGPLAVGSLPTGPSEPLSVSHSNVSEVVRAKTALGDFLMKRGEYDEAIVTYREALKLDRNNATLRQKLERAITDCKSESKALNAQFNCGAP